MNNDSDNATYYHDIAGIYNIVFANTLKMYARIDQPAQLYHDDILLSEQGTQFFSEMLKEVIKQYRSIPP